MSYLVINQAKNGKCVFASKNFKKGEFILEFRGKIYTNKNKIKGWDAKNNHFIQISKTEFRGPTRTADSYINHSCNPNSFVKIVCKRTYLHALRKIKKGEEILFDYSTTMYRDRWEMICNCGSLKCRKLIKEFKYLPVDIKKKYIKLGIVPDYVK